MKVICGLGNPGAEYAATRHNVGWWLLERLRVTFALPAFRDERSVEISEGTVGEHDVILARPLTYMNRSGQVLAPLAGRDDFDLVDDLLVAVDDVALEPGRIRFRPTGSSGGHNGLRSIEQVLGTREYGRVRIGVGAPPAGVSLVDWVLGPFDADSEGRVLDALTHATDGVRLWLDEGIEAAMQQCNGRDVE